MLTPEHINKQRWGRAFQEVCLRLYNVEWSKLKQDALIIWNSHHLISSIETRQEACFNLHKIWVEINEVLFYLQDPKRTRVNVITRPCGKGMTYKEVEFYFNDEWKYSKLFSDSEHLDQIYIEVMYRYIPPSPQQLDDYFEMLEREKRIEELLTEEDVEV